MDDQKIDMLQREIEVVRDDVREVRSDVKDLIKFKSKVMGIILVSTVICSAVFTIAMKLI